MAPRTGHRADFCVFVLTGNDTIDAGTGDDIVFGGFGNDIIHGGDVC